VPSWFSCPSKKDLHLVLFIIPPLQTVGVDRSHRQSVRFLALYALAAAGGSASYAPFLTILLPVRISEIAGTSSVQVLSYAAFGGAICASISNLLFGWLSDLTRNRTKWIVAGVIISCGLLISMRAIETVPQLLTMICLWQLSINMMLNPLAAWAGDCVPDNQKGTLGGLLAFAPGVGALAGALVTIPGLAGGDARLMLIAGLVCALVLPAVFLGRPRPMPHLMVDRTPMPAARPTGGVGPPRRSSVTVWRMWLARLVVQIAEAALFAFLLLWLRQIDPDVPDNKVAIIFTAVLFGSVPIAIGAGRWSDRTGRPMAPLILAVASSATGLLVMAASPSVDTAILGYCIFGMAAAVFLALHSSQTLRVLPTPTHRGRDLGLFNLTNTIPSLIMPGLTLLLIPLFGFEVLFCILALLVASAALLLATPRLR
jgi:MFS family permease